MRIRTKAILVIILTNLVIIIFSISAGVAFMNFNIQRSLTTDLDLIAEMADKYLSSEIEKIELKLGAVIQFLEANDQSRWDDVLTQQKLLNDEFLGLTVFDAHNDKIATAGDKAPDTDALLHVYKAFDGEVTLSSTCEVSDGVVFYIASPLNGNNDKIVVATLPGMYFADLLNEFRIWETGHIFVTDKDGYAISNPRENWIHSRFNYITIADIDESFADLAETVKLMTNGETGIGYYSLKGTGFSDTPRVCSYRPISSSKEGWSLGAVAPTTENPARITTSGLFVVAICGIALNVIFAVLASNFIRKPYEQIVALKESADAANKAKSNFLATMSHEIRSPLNIIVGLTNLRMEDASLPEDIRSDIVKINSAGDVLLDIVNDILDISKIEAGKIELINATYNTASLFNDIVTLNVTKIVSKPIKFIVDIDPNVPWELLGDELRIKQIFNNLLSNAFKYTQAGSVTLDVKYKKVSEDDVILEIVVADTGIGIRDKDIGKLFSDYSQVDTDAGRRSGGTGLGLAITKKLTELMNGSITVTSEYGVGTTFTVHVHQGFVADEALGKETVQKLSNFCYTDEKQHVSSRIVREDMSYAKVLVVDDYTSNLDVAAGMIGKYGIQVDCVTSGKAAIDKIKTADPVYNAVFMDHMMPEMDGIEATAIIRKLGTDYAKNIPIIALTANAIAGNEKMFLSSGFDAFLAKPIDMMELDTVLRKWVRDKSDKPAKKKKVLKTDEFDGKKAADMDKAIPGVDFSNLKKRCQNEEDLYLTVLRSFVPNAIESIGKIENVTEKTLTDYCINVHGLKSICANVCADAISQEAAQLEKLAKDGDIDEIVKRNKAFTESVEALAEAIKSWLDTYDSMTGKKVLKSPDKKILKKICKYCENYDMKGIDEAIEELDKSDYENDGEIVAWLRQKLLDSRFDEIIARLSDM